MSRDRIVEIGDQIILVGSLVMIAVGTAGMVAALCALMWKALS